MIIKVIYFLFIHTNLQTYNTSLLIKLFSYLKCKNRENINTKPLITLQLSRNQIKRKKV